MVATSIPAFAQAPTGDPRASQVVGLFDHSCMLFTENAAGLRTWIAPRQLPSLTPSDAPLFLGGKPAEAFMASNAVGKYALVSYDNRSCQAIAITGNADDVEQLLLSSLKQIGVMIPPLDQKSAPERGAMQKLFKAAFGDRLWTVSLTTHTHADAPNFPPELHLLATSG